MVKKVNTNYKGQLKRKETEPNKMEDDLMMDKIILNFLYNVLYTPIMTVHFLL